MASSSPSTELLLNSSRHMNDYFLHEDLPKPRLKMNCFFSTLSLLPWPPATCLSLCLRWWPCCWTTGQFYPTLTVLLGSSFFTFWFHWLLLLVHHSLWQLAVYQPSALWPQWPQRVFLCSDQGFHWWCLQGLWWWSVSLSPKYSSSFCLFCQCDADLIILYYNSLLTFYHSSKKSIRTGITPYSHLYIYNGSEPTFS